MCGKSLRALLLGDVVGDDGVNATCSLPPAAQQLMLLRTDTLRSSLRRSRGKQTPTTHHPKAEKRHTTYKRRGPARLLRELSELLFTTYYRPP